MLTTAQRALAARYGPIRHLILSSHAWDVRFRRLAPAAGRRREDGDGTS